MKRKGLFARRSRQSEAVPQAAGRGAGRAYAEKRFSILGDSISTLEGYNPNGYRLFYTGETCEQTGVRTPGDTWWGKVIDYFGGELLVNNSWSGSRVTKLPNQMTLFPSGCSDERTGGLHVGRVQPDVILVYLGINDWAGGVQAEGARERAIFRGKQKGRTRKLYPPAEDYIFAAAYERMLQKIKGNYPNAAVFCCTLNETRMPANPSFVFPHTYGGTHIERFNAVIRQKAAAAGCRVIDFYRHHTPYDSIDGTHPTAAGMNTLALLALGEMCEGSEASPGRESQTGR